MKKPRFHVYQARDGWRWQLKAANGRVLASGEAHTRKADAERAIATVVSTVRTISSPQIVNTIMVKDFGKPTLSQRQMAQKIKQASVAASRRNA
jgi:uncharacterized protein YegP (UPF0339 family)